MQEAFKNDPVKAIENIHDTPADADVWVYRIVVFALAAGAIFIIIGIFVLMGGDNVDTKNNTPIILTALGSAAIGALSGILVPSPKNRP